MKYLSLFLVLVVLSLAVLTGCSTDTDTTNSSAAVEDAIPEDFSEDDVVSTVDDEWVNGSDVVEIGSMI